ncbi:MAG TPA: aldo/keto reductase, partial [Arenibaculum sp.]|nr:aldo/keto reductase [Arenibaculum sp.]
MRYVEVKGLRVPALGFGTYRLAGAVCEHLVETALGIGYRHVDTARMYANEIEVGRAIEASGVRRDDIFLTTKIWMTDLAHDAVRRSVEDSLGKLRTGHVDLLLIHWPNPEIPMDETLRALREVRERGLTRAIGVSN